jgi:hypothetical protein
MNKKILWVVMPLLAITLVLAAGYIVNSFTIQSDVYEPFGNIEYAIIGDGGNWDGTTNCLSEGLDWKTYENGYNADVQGLYAGEGRKVCVRITNLAEADVDYTIKSTIVNEAGETYDKCLTAFGEPSVSGIVLKQATSINGVGLVISDGAAPVNDCMIMVETIRG